MIAPPKPPPQEELEALIKEARERQLRRRLLGAAGVAIAAAIGLGIYAIATGGTHNSGLGSGPGPQIAAAPCSSAAGWRLRLDGTWSEPTEQNTAPLAVTRIGASSCTLHGYPRIVLLGAGGNELDFPYSHRGDLVVAARAPRTVHVAGGGSAFFLINKNSCVVRNARLARQLQVRLPGVRGVLSLRLPHYPMLGYCPTGLTAIAVSPIVANLALAAAKLP
ncbi:MAG TPA: DUF4232 domain-containing protein [Gaiellaceae bacterium]|jgi:hypothetical protein